jgi:hypothetical protein
MGHKGGSASYNGKENDDCHWRSLCFDFARIRLIRFVQRALELYEM